MQTAAEAKEFNFELKTLFGMRPVKGFEFIVDHKLTHHISLP